MTIHYHSPVSCVKYIIMRLFHLEPIPHFGWASLSIFGHYHHNIHLARRDADRTKRIVVQARDHSIQKPHLIRNAFLIEPVGFALCYLNVLHDPCPCNDRACLTYGARSPLIYLMMSITSRSSATELNTMIDNIQYWKRLPGEARSSRNQNQMTCGIQ